MQIAEHFIDLANYLRESAETLEKWAEQSIQGGWSTHQVEANQKMALEMRTKARLCEKLAGQTVVT